MSNYEIFDLLYCDFRDKFEDESRVFTQKYVASLQQINVFEEITTVKTLNELQEKFVYQKQ